MDRTKVGEFFKSLQTENENPTISDRCSVTKKQKSSVDFWVTARLPFATWIEANL